VQAFCFLIFGVLVILLIVHAIIFVRKYVRTAQREQAMRESVTMTVNPISPQART